jgi:DNA repair ATPase RecN
LRPGEEEALIRERKLLMEHEKLFSFINDAVEALADYRGGSLGLARKSLGGGPP